MNEERLLKILLSPHVTEKTSMVGTEAAKQYAFKVARDASKYEILKAIESLLDVKVASVRTVMVKGKQKTFGRVRGVKSDWKKAYVTLQPGSEFEMHDAQA